MPAERSPSAVRRVDLSHQLNRFVTRAAKPPFVDPRIRAPARSVRPAIGRGGWPIACGCRGGTAGRLGDGRVRHGQATRADSDRTGRAGGRPTAACFRSAGTICLASVAARRGFGRSNAHEVTSSFAHASWKHWLQLVKSVSAEAPVPSTTARRENRGLAPSGWFAGMGKLFRERAGLARQIESDHAGKHGHRDHSQSLHGFFSLG